MLKFIIPVAFNSIQCTSMRSSHSFAPSLLFSLYLGQVIDLPECPVENKVHFSLEFLAQQQ